MDLGHLFDDTVTYASVASFSDGDFTLGTQTTAKGRLEESHSVVTMTGGEERIASYEFTTRTAIPLHAMVWVSGANTAVASAALRVLRRRFAKTLDGGYSYYLVTLGR